MRWAAVYAQRLYAAPSAADGFLELSQHPIATASAIIQSLLARLLTLQGFFSFLIENASYLGEPAKAQAMTRATTRYYRRTWSRVVPLATDAEAG